MPFIHKGSRNTSLISTAQGPKSYIGLALFVMICMNPPLGLIALIFSIVSRVKAPTDWEGAEMHGKFAMGFSIAGIITTVVGGLIFVLIFFSRDTH